MAFGSDMENNLLSWLGVSADSTYYVMNPALSFVPSLIGTPMAALSTGEKNRLSTT